MEFRIGINLGDVMIDDHDIFGEGVNIASRLQSLATPGGILISGSVHDQVKNKLALGFNFMGHQQVKNISEQVPVFVVAHDAAPVMAAGAGVAALGGLGRAAPAAAAKAPALLPLRFGAGVIDALAACVLTFAIAAGLQSAVGPVFEIDAPYSLLASRSHDLDRTAVDRHRRRRRGGAHDDAFDRRAQLFRVRAADLSPDRRGVDRRPVGLVRRAEDEWLQQRGAS